MPEPVTLPDGVYQVTQPKFVAGFIIRKGKVVRFAPILRKRLGYWMKVAERVG
jgi:hypothetical protein